ncbi:hypothetical protein ACQLKB_001997 [Salmonella enterica subsp. enterica serovar Kentucky]
MQDHFSLDSNDITHWLYSHWMSLKFGLYFNIMRKRGMSLSHLYTKSF